MIYRGFEEENRAGNHVEYYQGKWYAGTLVEPVKYQLVNTKEHGGVILSCTTPYFPKESDYRKSVENVANGAYNHHDLKILKGKLDGMSSEVESVTITEK